MEQAFRNDPRQHQGSKHKQRCCVVQNAQGRTGALIPVHSVAFLLCKDLLVPFVLSRVLLELSCDGKSVLKVKSKSRQEDKGQIKFYLSSRTFQR